MKIKANFYCPDIIGELRSGDYELPEGADIAALFAQAQAEAGVSYDEDVKTFLNLMVNNIKADWGTVLHDGDVLRMLFKIYGG